MADAISPHTSRVLRLRGCTVVADTGVANAARRERASGTIGAVDDMVAAKTCNPYPGRRRRLQERGGENAHGDAVRPPSIHPLLIWAILQGGVLESVSPLRVPRVFTREAGPWTVAENTGGMERRAVRPHIRRGPSQQLVLPTGRQVTNHLASSDGDHRDTNRHMVS